MYLDYVKKINQVEAPIRSIISEFAPGEKFSNYATESLGSC